MKLDVTCMRYLTKDDYRVLTAVEMGMRNHELVPVELISQIAKLKHGGSFKVLSTLLRFKLVAHASNKYDGYRLSYLGYDVLALRALLSRGVISSVGAQIGVGKESDVFEAMDENGNELVLKIHRLGRTSFRAVRRQRDYMADRHKASWLYMSRLAATKEYLFMGILHALRFPVPIPIDHSRHVVAMSRVHGSPLSQLRAGAMTEDAARQHLHTALRLLARLAEHDLVHCDLNEFNLLLSATPAPATPDEAPSPYGHLVLIDFPQMVSCKHMNAADLFARDCDGLAKFFGLKMRLPVDEDLLPMFDAVRSESAGLGLTSAYDALFSRPSKPSGTSGAQESQEEEMQAGSGDTDRRPLLTPQDDTALLHYISNYDSAAKDGENADGVEGGEEVNEDDVMGGDEIDDAINDSGQADGERIKQVETTEVRDEIGWKSEVDGVFDDDYDDDDDDELDENTTVADRDGAAQGLRAKDSDTTVRNKVRMEIRGRQGGGASTQSHTKGNTTKKRNKYGKIDRSHVSRSGLDL